MVTYQCVSCSKRHLNAPPTFCDCGSVSFSALAERGQVDTAKAFTYSAGSGDDGANVVLNELAAGFAPDDADELEPVAASSTSGPTAPPPVSGSSSGSASAPKPGADFEPDDEPEHVGGIECGQEGCSKPATHKFFWPSADEPSLRFACEEHARKAAELAPALGFSADVQPL
jgi:hypothetical protein